MRIKSFLTSLAFLLFAGQALALGSPASGYFQNPTYIPISTSSGGTVTTASLAAAGGTVNIGPFLLQASTATSRIGVSGTFTGLTATVYVTSDKSNVALPNWVAVPVTSPSGQFSNTITSSGIWAVDIAGASQVQIAVTAVATGSVSIDYSAGLGDMYDITFMGSKTTYHATTGALTPPASATDLFTIYGSASKTIAVNHIECGGQATTSSSKPIQLALRSTANTGGTTQAPSIVSSDQNDPTTPTATVLAYTAVPTTGTLIGYLRHGVLNLPAAAAVGTPPLSWDFGPQSRNFGKDIILRGTNQGLAVNGLGAAFPSGSTIYCSVEWTES